MTSAVLARLRRQEAWVWVAGGLGLVLAVAILWLLVSDYWAKGTGHWAAVEQGRHFLHQGRPDLALRAVMNVRDEKPGAGAAMEVAGLAWLQLNQRYGSRQYPIRTAQIALERALKLQPHQLAATKALAAIHAQLGNGEKAIELLQSAARLDPNDPALWQAMGRVQHDMGRPAEAAAAFEKALRLAPRDGETRRALIAELLNSRQPEPATPWVEAALKDEPNEPKVLGLAARHAYELGKTQEAAGLADRALARDAAELDALLVRAKVRVAEGRLREASVDLEHALIVSPNNLGALQLLAQVESALGLEDRAAKTAARLRQTEARIKKMDDLVRQIAQRPDDPTPRFELGQAAAEGGSYELARQCFQAALALDPNLGKARAALAALPPPKTLGPTSAPNGLFHEKSL
jgi:tetratricopeptide (TPR) repeat protein